jgi:hypothetical protein
MQFIIRYYGEFARLHIAERAIVPNLPEWRKMPLCRNGGLNLKKWSFIELEPEGIAEISVCGGCMNRLASMGFTFTWGDDVLGVIADDPMTREFERVVGRDDD